MKLSKTKPSFMLLLVTALLVLLPLLAILQYRWLGEVSAAERERMQANLRNSAERFCADFDRELTNAFVQLQSPLLPNSTHPAADFASRYHRWAASAPNPKLITEIYRTSADETEGLKILRFNQASNIFESAEWPEKLLPLRKRFELQQFTQESTQKFLQGIFKQNDISPELLSQNKSRGFILKVTSGQVADDIPALIIPDIAQPFSPAAMHVLANQNRACTIAVLNEELIKNEILPSLIKRHFTIDGVNEYNLAVVKRGTKREVVFNTDPNMPLAAYEQSDAKSSLFKIRTDELDRIFVTTALPSMPVPPPHPAKGDADGNDGNDSSNRVAVRVLQSDVNISQTVTKPALPDQSQKVAVKRSFPLPVESEIGWQLLVKHRAGSLDAAVGNLRRRNLAISFGILILLGASVGFIVISSRRAQRLASQQMEFVAGVSHELRTPLAVICSAAENLADGVIDNGEQIKRYGGLIRDEGRRLTGMVEQVLEFAGAQSRRKTYELRPTELERVIEDAIAACHMQLQEGGFEIETYVPADLPMINADAAALSRAIQNLLHNAMKYSGDSRWIGLTVETVKADNANEISIKVSDQGIGIASSDLAHIFEPFYRGKEVVASQIHGNGLGLSLVKHIVEAHGGTVTVESKAGQESAFTLRLPLIVAEQFKSETTQEAYEQTHLAR